MEKFSKISDRAAKRKGGKKALDELMPETKKAAALKRIKDDRWLAMMTKCVFQAGFVWRVVENKWLGFEEAFHQFHPKRVAMMHDEELEGLLKNEAIIRNWKKILSTRHNAQFVCDLAEEHGSASKFFADWPVDDQVGLLEVLKKRGQRLSGSSGQFLLRFMGKDGFMLSPDVVKALIAQGVVDKAPTGKGAMKKVQEAFNAWADESGKPMSHISRILALSVD